jgi:low temperature requirement protein LtrA
MVIIGLGECVLGAANAVANLWRGDAGGSGALGVVGLGSMLLVLALWWLYSLLPSGQALHHHRERAFGWGYGHYVAFAAVAAVGAGLEVVAVGIEERTAGGDT